MKYSICLTAALLTISHYAYAGNNTLDMPTSPKGNKSILEFQSNKDFYGACDFAVKQARSGADGSFYYYAATCHDKYKNISVSNSEHVTWLTTASKKGHHGAYSKLGKLYEAGLIVKGDPKKSIDLYRKALKHHKKLESIPQSFVESFFKSTNSKINELLLYTDCDLSTTKVFNKNLKCLERSSMKSAITENGGDLIKQTQNIDVYESSKLLEHSKTLSVFYTDNNDFACMQYEISNFKSLSTPEKLTALLIDKYGRPSSRNTKLRNGGAIKWFLKDGIDIRLTKNILLTRLTYCNPAYEKIFLSEKRNRESKTMHTERLKMNDSI